MYAKSEAVNAALRGIVFSAILATTPALKVSAQVPDAVDVDLSGIWARIGEDIVPLGDGNVPFRPWSEQVFSDSAARQDANEPFVDNRTICLPDGPVDLMFTPYLVQLVQTSAKVHMLIEFNNQVRTIHMDTDHPAELEPRWYGHSVGRWEGDTLKVETVGINDLTPLMTLFRGLTGRSNIPHSDALRLLEDFSLSDDGQTLTVMMTFDDPLAFTEPWTIEVNFARQEEEKLIEFVCADDPEVAHPDLEGLITVGMDGKYPLDLETVAP